MSKSNELFEVVAERLATVQKSLVALVLFAACYSAADLMAGHYAAKALNDEFYGHRQFKMNAEDIAGRLRYTLSYLYPARGTSERQQLLLLIQDIRRARRNYQYTGGADTKLSEYTNDILPLTGEGISRKTLQAKLDRGYRLAYFNVQQPGQDSADVYNAFINVSINELTAEAGINQLPTSHLGLLLLGALSVPGDLADSLEHFAHTDVSSTALIELDRSVEAINKRGEILNVSISQNGKTSEKAATEFLDAFIDRSLGIASGQEASIRASKYANASIDDLNRLLVEVATAYYGERSREQGLRAIDIPGTTVRLPGYLYLFGLPILLLILIYTKSSMAGRGKGAPLPEGATLQSLEVKYGYSVVALLGHRPPEGRAGAILQLLVVAVVPLGLAVPIAITRGVWTLSLSLPLGLVVLASELRLASNWMRQQRP